MDALFGMTEKTKAGAAKKGRLHFASTDLVALDSVAATVMGFPPNSIKHVAFAQKEGFTEVQVSKSLAIQSLLSF